MIPMHNKTFNLRELKELEIASQNLPDNLNIFGHSEPEFEKFKDMGVIFVPYTAKNFMELPNTLFEKRAKLEWGSIKEDSFNINCDLSLNKIHESFEFVDFYYHNYSIYSDYLQECEIRFRNSITRLTLFSYFYAPSHRFRSIFVGTFARVTDGWKFYPKFQEYNKSLGQILSKYKEML